MNYVHNWIGNTTANPNRELVGKIDDVRIYNKALDANEIAQILLQIQMATALPMRLKSLVEA